MAILQIPSMAYPPSSSVRHFTRITILSNLNDFLIAGGVFRHRYCGVVDVAANRYKCTIHPPRLLPMSVGYPTHLKSTRDICSGDFLEMTVPYHHLSSRSVQLLPLYTILPLVFSNFVVAMPDNTKIIHS